MNWFYAIDGQKNGPISGEQLGNLLLTGKINQATLVWREGMPDWQPLGQARGANPPPLIGQPAGSVCIECGRSFPPSELIQVNHSHVCAECKPLFLQRLSEGAPLPSSTVGLWRMKKRVVTTDGTVFPDRCIKCNQPANGFRMKRVLYWQHPAYYFFLLCNILVLLIVIFIVRKKAVVHIGLCPRHRTQRSWAMTICLIGVIGGILMLIVGAGLQSGIAAAIGGLALLAGIVAGAGWGRTVAATKMTKENVWVTGAKREFLDTLPDWPGP